MTKITTVIFDFGGVLIDWNPEYLFQKTIPDAEKRAYFFKHICTHDWNLAQDAGRPIAEATEALVKEHPEWAQEIRDFYGRWTEMLGGPIHETVKLLQELRDRGAVRLLGLTNWSNETFPIALDNYEFLHWFEGIVMSGDEKTRKPFADIYETLLDRYGVDPKTAVFIDDNHANVLAAEALGINGIHFDNPAQLRKSLEQLGLLD